MREVRRLTAPRTRMNAIASVLYRFKPTGDFWGGFASMLVALPASVAFGVTVYSAISPQYAVFGALAGILGAILDDGHAARYARAPNNGGRAAQGWYCVLCRHLAHRKTPFKAQGGGRSMRRPGFPRPACAVAGCTVDCFPKQPTVGLPPLKLVTRYSPPLKP